MHRTTWAQTQFIIFKQLSACSENRTLLKQLNEQMKQKYFDDFDYGD